MKLTYEEKQVLGFHVIECYGPNPRQVCFINHGFTSNKAEGTYFMMFELAKLGLHVVAMDAYKHGTRLEEPFVSGQPKEKEGEILKIVVQTAKDIKYLFEEHYSKNYRHCMILGISMGGAVTYLAGAMIPEAKWVIPIIGFPSLVDIYRDSGGQGYDEAWLERYDPLNRLNDMAGKHILIVNSDNDQVVDIKYARKYYHALLEAETCDIEMYEFEAYHNVTPDMRVVVYQKIQEYLTEK